MPRFKIVHNAPVWERTVTWVEVTDEQAARIHDDPELVDDLLSKAILNDEAIIEVTGGIESMDSDYEIEEESE
ncbi:hypothetical protein LCGC14_2997690 [marine sediment metagenome]|uniref:Uncharacterized protein n=1 Tax=marine sediment metagenome TaxID=412755 RepID=A0A0F8ZT36_9ZZZZ